MGMWSRGRRLFSTAAVLMLVTAALHTFGNLAHKPQSDQEVQILAGMAGLHFPAGMGMTPSLLDIYWCLMLTMSITFVALGVINLAAAGSRDVGNRALRSMAWVNLLWVGAFSILSWHYRIPPPLISGVVLEAVVIGSLITTPRA